jgi:hypothetical protein
MADTKLRVLIETLYKGQGAKKAERGFKGLGAAANKAEGKISAAMGGMVAGAAGVGAALFALKKGFDFAKEGAQLAKVEDTFESLSRSIGTSSSSMLRSLREATAGMVTDIELMSANSRFLSMGLADSADEAANLSRIAVTLGGAMGKEAGPAMEEFALLMANQSIPRLDTFGISAGKVRQRIKDLQAATPGLSRETAFMTATMEEAAVAMEKVGNAVPTDPYTQLEVSVSNLTDAMKMQAADGLGPTLSLIAEGAQLRRDLNEAIDEGTLSEKRHNDVLGIRQLWTRDAIDDAKMLMGEVEESRKVYEDFFRGLEAGDDRLIEAERNQAALAATQEEATEITEEQKKEWLDAALAASEFAGAEDDLVVGADKVAASAITAALHIVEYEQSLLDAEIAAERAAAQADTFMSTLSGGESDILIFNETMAELAEGHQKATVDTDGLTQALFNQLGRRRVRRLLRGRGGRGAQSGHHAAGNSRCSRRDSGW